MKLILITLALSFSAFAAPETPERAKSIVQAVDKSLREKVLNCEDVMYFENQKLVNPVTTDMLNLKEAHDYAEMEVELDLQSSPATITFKQNKEGWSSVSVATLSEDKKTIIGFKTTDKQKKKFSDLSLAEVIECPEEAEIVTHTLECK